MHMSQPLRLRLWITQLCTETTLGGNFNVRE